MPFNYAYAVQDQYSGNDFSHDTNSDGKVTTGEYRVLLPDGRTQIVTYTADHYNGYQAEVTYEGEARPYEPQPSASYNQPRPSYEQPKPRQQYEQPKPRQQYEQPKPRQQYEQPKPRQQYEQPEPRPTYEQPRNTYEQPKNTYEQPKQQRGYGF